MPGINGRVQEMCYEIAIDVLSMKIGEEKIFSFKGEDFILKRLGLVKQEKSDA